MPRKRARRNDQMRQLCPELCSEPMFCLEYAIKFFFWSVLMYDYTEAEGATFQKLPEAIRELMGEVEAAMQLFGLSKRHMFYDRDRGTKVVVAWSADVILLSVRGSAERANFIEDAKVRQPRYLMHQLGGNSWHLHARHRYSQMRCMGTAFVSKRWASGAMCCSSSRRRTTRSGATGAGCRACIRGFRSRGWPPASATACSRTSRRCWTLLRTAAPCRCAILLGMLPSDVMCPHARHLQLM